MSVPVHPVRKKLVSPFYSIWVGALSSSYTNGSCWLVLQMSHDHTPVGNGYVHFTVPNFVTFTKLVPAVHLDIDIHRCNIMVVLVIVLHFMLEWLWLGRKSYIFIAIHRCSTFTTLTPTEHVDIIYRSHGWYSRPTFYACMSIVRKKWTRLNQRVLFSPKLHQLFILV